MTHSTLILSTVVDSTSIRSTLLIVALTALTLSVSAGSALAADDAARPHHNNDKPHACRHEDQEQCIQSSDRGYKRHAKHHRHGGKRSAVDMEQFRERMEKFALSDTQKQDMAALMGIYQPRFKSLRERGQAAREALFNAAPDAEAYAQLVDKVSSEAAKTASEVVVLLAELQANAYALLTDEQQSEYRALKTKAKARADEFRDKAKQRSEEKKAQRKKPVGEKPN